MLAERLVQHARGGRDRAVDHVHADPLVAQPEEGRQKVVAVAAPRPPRADDAEDDVVERPERAAWARPQRRTAGEEEPDRRIELGGDVTVERRDGLAQRVRRSPDVHPEERPRDDVEREPAHLRGDVEHLPAHRVPAVQHELRPRGHQLAQRRDPLAMERGLDEPSLPEPERPFAGEKPIAEHGLQHPVVEIVLAVVRVPLLKHVADAVRMRDERDAPEEEPEHDHVAVLASRRREEPERILPHAAEDAKRPTRAGGHRGAPPDLLRPDRHIEGDISVVGEGQAASGAVVARYARGRLYRICPQRTTAAASEPIRPRSRDRIARRRGARAGRGSQARRPPPAR